MVQINFGQREVSCKLVYYGPGMSGKTTNLEIIHQKAPDNSKGEMVSIATETDRTLYFDYLPLDLGQVAGMHTKFQLYTVPGQIYYNATRKLVLQGVDGVIFVADSSAAKMDENIESLDNLRDNLADMNLRLEDLCLVLQYNKRDLPDALPVAEIDKIINPMGVPTCEAVARDGKGVFAALKLLSKLVIEKLNAEHAPGSQRRRSASDMRPGTGTPGSGRRPVTTGIGAAAGGARRPGSSPALTPAQGVPVTAQTPSSGNRAVPPPVSAAPPQAAAPPRPAAAAPPPQPQRPTAPRQNADPAALRRNQHLAKAAPQPLNQGAGQAMADNGSTDPSLRRYKQGGGGVVKSLVIIFLTLLIMLVILGALVLFVPAVRDAIRPLLPPEVQRLLLETTEPAGDSGAPSRPEVTP